MVHVFGVIVIGILVGTLGALVSGRKRASSWLVMLFGGLLGAWIGEWLLSQWQLQMGGLLLVPAIAGAAIVVLIIALGIAIHRQKVL